MFVRKWYYESEKILEAKQILENKIKLYEQHQKNMDFEKIDQILARTQQRGVDIQFKYFVRDILSKDEIYRHYSIRSLFEKKKIQHIKSFRPVRGDGNCFYTAFGFRFLEILMSYYTYLEFLQFLERIQQQKLNFQINSIDIAIPEQQQQLLLDYYLYLLCKIKLQDNRQEKLLQKMRAYEFENDEIDGRFNCLTIIFLRNLAYSLIKKFEKEYLIYDMDNLFKWEVECDNNDVVISVLTEYLDLQTIVYFIQNGQIETLNYQENKYKYFQVLLLFSPGHYNIGIQ